jgi:electron transfer flavoprotein alpha subunit
MSNILLIAEFADEKPSALTRELLGLAHRLASGGGVVVLAFTPTRNALEALATYGADHICWCECAQEYEGERWVAVAEQVARDVAPVAILAGHTPAGAELAPRLAFRLESAVATGCTAVTAESGTLFFTRGCFGGNVRETLSFSSAPAVATIRPGVGEALTRHDGTAEVVRVDVPTFAPRVRVLARERETVDSKRLEDAKIIVAGGRGLEGPEGFRVLEKLATALGGAVGASRVPCDLGWCPHSWQIGLTGKTVTPDLYIAVGISGAGQHMAGCGNARTIVAINTDPDAAIFRDARFGLVGDYRKLVPALTTAVAALKADSAAAGAA